MSKHALCNDDIFATNRLTYAAGFDGPHISPTGKTFWVSRSNPSSHVYGDVPPGRDVPGSESPSAVAATMTLAPDQQPPATLPNGQASESKPKPEMPDAPARRAAAALHDQMGDKAAVAIHQLIKRLRANPGQGSLLAAAESIRDELLERGHASGQQQSQKPPPNAPGIFRDLANASQN